MAKDPLNRQQKSILQVKDREVILGDRGNPPDCCCRKASGWLKVACLAALLTSRHAAGDERDIPSGLELCAESHYSFGCAAATDGRIVFTEFARQRIVAWDALTGQSQVLVRGLPGLFGIAVESQGRIFAGLDLGDHGAPGSILRIAPSGDQETVVRRLTRPRQLAIDQSGTLFFCTESPGRVVRWDPCSGQEVELATGLMCPQGVAPANDGSVYFVEYGDFSAEATTNGTGPKPGRVRVIRKGGRVENVIDGIWRARGLALHLGGLIVASEADREDHGNSGQLLLVDLAGKKCTVLLSGLDYPQFPNVASEGEIYFTLARDNQLARWSDRRKHILVKPANHVGCDLGVWGGRWHSPTAMEPTIRLSTPSIQRELAVDAAKDSRRLSGWAYFPAADFDCRKDELSAVRNAEHPCPGTFELPRFTSVCTKGSSRVAVIPVRSHIGCRWPMTHVGTAKETAAPGFSETPRGYLVYFEWQAGSSAATHP